MVLLVGLAALGAAAGCGGRPALNVGDGEAAGQGGGGQGGGGGDLAPSCESLDANACKSRADCKTKYCQGCAVAPSFAGCTTPGSPPVACPAVLCDQQTCNTLDEATCKTRGDCTALSCPDCLGGQAFRTCGRPGDHVNCGPCPPSCAGLDENKCKASGYCHPAYCGNCSGAQVFASCVGPNDAVPCPALRCPAPPPCDTLDQTSCKTRSDCHPSYCPNCAGGQTFALCAASNEAAACPAIACPVQLPCTNLGEVACGARGDCRPGYCNGCQGRMFVGCGDPGTGFARPAIACPVRVACANVTDLLSCDARSDCHAVFVDHSNVCDCAVAGCCIAFNRCADGGKAACKGPTGTGGAPFCTIPPPGCGGAYVTSYTAYCYEGCVRPTECAP